jgi:hypothetical protein
LFLWVSHRTVSPLLNTDPAFAEEVDMRDIKERLSLLWILALLNYLYADVLALWAIPGSPGDTPHFGQWVLAPSAVLMEIPIAMILASRLLPFRANRLANLVAASLETLVNGFLTFIPPLVGWGRPPALPEYLFFATIETVCTVYIVWLAWNWSEAKFAASSARAVGHWDGAIPSASMPHRPPSAGVASP